MKSTFAMKRKGLKILDYIATKKSEIFLFPNLNSGIQVNYISRFTGYWAAGSISKSATASEIRNPFSGR